MTIALDFNLRDRVDLPNRRSLGSDRADVLKVINQRPANPQYCSIDGECTTNVGKALRQNTSMARGAVSSQDKAVAGDCYGRADFAGNRAAQVNWLSLSERIRWQ
jgi:hypothetical protein